MRLSKVVQRRLQLGGPTEYCSLVSYAPRSSYFGRIARSPLVWHGRHSARRFATYSTQDEGFLSPIFTKRDGIGVVHDPLTNKGTGFPMPERDRLGIRGLVPPRTLSLATQCEKILHTFDKMEDDISKSVYLSSLQDRNETLFYRVLIDNIEKLAPYVYTPTVGKVCEVYGSTIFRRPRGMYFSSLDKNQMAAMVHNWPNDDVQVVVITDGSRILGLGDLGANGMGIPIGKLALYVATGGIDPAKVLPVMLDCGTNNSDLLADPYYLGVQHQRLRGKAYFSLLHECLSAIHSRWPKALIQFEDFSTDTAQAILDKYRHSMLCFNDDIQGTGSVTSAGILTALRIQARKQFGDENRARLSEQRIVVAGAGSAGLGVSQALVRMMEEEGTSELEASNSFWVVDADGVLGSSRLKEDTESGQSLLTNQQRYFSRTDEEGNESLIEVVRRVKPTILLGLTGVKGIFTKDVVTEMAKHCDAPIIFPLSNPTSKAECTASQAYEWTSGRAVFASGSPFAPVQIGDQTYHPSQCNNMFIFPGIGLGANVVHATQVTNDMFNAASLALSNAVTQEEIDCGMVFPSIARIRDVTQTVATAVAEAALTEGVADYCPRGGADQSTFADLRKWVGDQMFDPVYRPLISSK
eukprot:gb/GECG01008468.1/.p1 GENE.gb/GECG01008468.1/~~gb/GECG01008468.1/.p1  ORF type:complete len:638 (+),score=60.72 gb/GECG01008468.1/:1-1914(+)